MNHCDFCGHSGAGAHVNEPVFIGDRMLFPCLVCPCPDYVPFVGYYGPPPTSEREFDEQ